MAHWYYKNSHTQTVGPLTLNEIEVLTLSGRIQHSTLIRYGQFAEWSLATAIPELSAALKSAADASRVMEDKLTRDKSARSEREPTNSRLIASNDASFPLKKDCVTSLRLAMATVLTLLVATLVIYCLTPRRMSRSADMALWNATTTANRWLKRDTKEGYELVSSSLASAQSFSSEYNQEQLAELNQLDIATRHQVSELEGEDIYAAAQRHLRFGRAKEGMDEIRRYHNEGYKRHRADVAAILQADSVDAAVEEMLLLDDTKFKQMQDDLAQQSNEGRAIEKIRRERRIQALPLAIAKREEQLERRVADSKAEQARKEASLAAMPDDQYFRDVKAIKSGVLADTINPKSAVFCTQFEIIHNARGNRVYVGWYISNDLKGRPGRDNIIAEVSSTGRLVKLSIGDI